MKPIDYAKAYLQLGWSLIPIKPDTKTPPIKWAEYCDTKATIFEVEEWLSKGWWLAVVTGDISGLVVVDDDRIKHNLKEWGFDSPVVAKTQSGGKHYYFKYDREIHSHQNHEIFVDLKGWHSYCLLPPFKGRTWIKSPTKNIDKLKPLSDEIVRLLNSDKKEQNSDPLRMADFVDIPDGSRTDSLYRIAMSTFQKMPKDDALRVLAGVNATYNPPLTEKEFKYQTSRALQKVTIGTKVPVVARDNSSTQKTPSVIYSKMSDTEIDDYETRPYLPVGLSKLDREFPFPSGWYVILGNPGSGKSFMSLWMARQFFVKHKKKSVLFTLEMSEEALRPRIMQSWSDLTLDQYRGGVDTRRAKELMKKDALEIYPFGQADSSYQTPANFKKDFEEYYQKGIRVFFFDHFHELEGTTDNNTNPQVTEAWSKTFGDISKEYDDVWLFVFAQPNKGGARKTILRREDVGGSGKLTQKCDFVLSINRKVKNGLGGEVEVISEDRSVILYVDKSRFFDRTHFGIRLHFDDTGNFRDPNEPPTPQESGFNRSYKD